MASRVFNKALEGCSLEYMQQEFAVAARRLNENRDARNEQRYARMGVSPVLHQRGWPTAFYVTFSDKDGKAIKTIVKVEKRLKRQRCFGFPCILLFSSIGFDHCTA